MQARALGRRVSDEFAVPLCRTHHRALHRSGDEAAWWKTSGIDAVTIAHKLWQHTRLNGAPIQQHIDPLLNAASVRGGTTARPIHPRDPPIDDDRQVSEVSTRRAEEAVIGSIIASTVALVALPVLPHARSIPRVAIAGFPTDGLDRFASMPSMRVPKCSVLLQNLCSQLHSFDEWLWQLGPSAWLFLRRPSAQSLHEIGGVEAEFL
jgi:hypothetical protein